MKDGITDLEKKIPSNEEHENFQTFEKLVSRETIIPSTKKIILNLRPDK